MLSLSQNCLTPFVFVHNMISLGLTAMTIVLGHTKRAMSIMLVYARIRERLCLATGHALLCFITCSRVTWCRCANI